MKVTIYDESYEVGCARCDEEKIRQLAQMINERFIAKLIKQFEIKKNIGRDHMLALALIKMADELSEVYRKLETARSTTGDNEWRHLECRFDRLEALLAQVMEKV